MEDDVYVPKPVDSFSGEDPFVRMAKVRGQSKEIAFDETYPYLDKSLRFRIQHAICYAALWTIAFPVNRIRYGLKIKGRSKVFKNRKLLRGGAMTVCNHVFRWDMICVLQAIRFRKSWIPMYALPFTGKDSIFMKSIGGIPIPENRSGLKCFNEAMNEIRERKEWIHIFPESCSWKYYSPIRPFKIGPFNMAYKYGMPILPCVISFRERTGIYKLFGSTDEPLVTISIGDPIVPDKDKPRKEESEHMRKLAHKTMEEMAGIISNPWPSAID
ncbi:MAG: 1-acyl-sn-glycerol-3-phosphate acyltransferase [Bacteroidales bacterium]|nr:1-acyl-sn-glycerol-3-phosphate acyltransferase [Bacteroidales bacterium]